MSPATRECLDERRRDEVRRRGLNGLDYLEVSDSQLQLTVYFLGHAPEGLGRRNVRITGGERVRGIRVTGVQICPQHDPELDNCMVVTVDRPGDFSTYRLCLVDLPPDAPFDPRYRCLDFTFKAGCPAELDCARAPACPPEERRPPEISYLAKDYASFRRLILDRLSQAMPEWAERHVPDLGITLAELLAYVGDYLSYYQDAAATEAYLDTARQRISVRRHARLVDYAMHEGCNARAWVHVEASGDLTGERAPAAAELSFLTRFEGMPRARDRVPTWDDLRGVPASRYEVFEPLGYPPGAKLSFRAAHNAIRFHTWGDAGCCLARGATSATLVDSAERVRPRADEEPGPGGGGGEPHPYGEAGEHPAAAPERAEPGGEPDEQSYERGDRSMADTGERIVHDSAGERYDERDERHDEDDERYDQRDEQDGRYEGRDREYGDDGEERERRHHRHHDHDHHGRRRHRHAHGHRHHDHHHHHPPPAGHELPPRVLQLEPGDVLIFEEVLGPGTGEPADADPARRHAVRLTRVEKTVDALYGQPLLEIAWADEDRLPFPLCLSAVGGEECRLIEDVSVARGNVVLADHGRRVPPEDLGCVRPEDEEPRCEREGRPADRRHRARRFRPALAGGPLTFGERLPPGSAGLSATRLLLQDPQRAVPRIALRSRADRRCGAGRGGPWRAWSPRPDLLASGRDEPDFVAEIDDRGRARLRFGDGAQGRSPRPGETFEAVYRVGNGPAGNVGADSIALAVTTGPVSGVTLAPRNPLPAAGGTAPETVAQAKLMAPYAFLQEQERAVTADDYARLAERLPDRRHPVLQGAAAELRWNGSWHEVQVAVDPRGRAGADDALLEQLRAGLERFRRIGHDLAVRPARYVALDVALRVCVQPGFQRGHVRAALLERFGTGRLAGGSRAFFNPDELGFGQGISLSRMVAAAQALPGVESVAVTRLERLFQGPGGEIEQGVLPIGPFEIARLDNDPDFPERGRIRLDLRGGR